MPKETAQDCPVEWTLETIGGKWKCVILWHLRNRSRRFNELRRLIPAITQKMLTAQLRDLERDGLISRKAHLEVPPRVEYSISAYGTTLSPLLEMMCKWGARHQALYSGERKRPALRSRRTGKRRRRDLIQPEKRRLGEHALRGVPGGRNRF